jgi:hypothetical protein
MVAKAGAKKRQAPRTGAKIVIKLRKRGMGRCKGRWMTTGNRIDFAFSLPKNKRRDTVRSEGIEPPTLSV